MHSRARFTTIHSSLEPLSAAEHSICRGVFQLLPIVAKQEFHVHPLLSLSFSLSVSLFSLSLVFCLACIHGFVSSYQSVALESSYTHLLPLTSAQDTPSPIPATLLTRLAFLLHAAENASAPAPAPASAVAATLRLPSTDRAVVRTSRWARAKPNTHVKLQQNSNSKPTTRRGEKRGSRTPLIPNAVHARKSTRKTQP